MESGMNVILYEKQQDGELRQVDEQNWSVAMITSLQHVNYVIVAGEEYETLEGRLNLDNGKLEILVVPMRNH